ncbi:MAG: hypothetical protein KDA60_03345 [Planctomycetales bacterium]|nr:hypothetical protein [Planctomycetales bacterium]
MLASLYVLDTQNLVSGEYQIEPTRVVRDIAGPRVDYAQIDYLYVSGGQRPDSFRVLGALPSTDLRVIGKSTDRVEIGAADLGSKDEATKAAACRGMMIVIRRFGSDIR